MFIYNYLNLHFHAPDLSPLETWNSPAWYVPENDHTFYSNRPLFIKPLILDDIKSKKSRISLKNTYKSNVRY